MEFTLQQILSDLVEYIIAKEPETRNMRIYLNQGSGIIEVNVEQEKCFVKGVKEELKPGWISDIDKGLYRQEGAGQEYASYLKPNDYDARCKTIPCQTTVKTSIEVDGRTIATQEEPISGTNLGYIVGTCSKDGTDQNYRIFSNSEMADNCRAFLISQGEKTFTQILPLDQIR